MEFIDHVAKLAKVSNNGIEIPIYVTELGWPTHVGRYGVSEDESAWFLARYLILAASRQYVKGVFWYCLMDQGTDPGNKEHRFGILDRSQQAKPAAREFRRVTDILKGVSQTAIRQDGTSSIAVIYQAGVATGQFVWHEDLGSNNTIGNSQKTVDGGTNVNKIDTRMPLWQPASPAVRPR